MFSGFRRSEELLGWASGMRDRQTDGCTGRGEWTDTGTANRLYCTLSAVYRKIRGRMSIWHYA